MYLVYIALSLRKYIFAPFLLCIALYKVDSL